MGEYLGKIVLGLNVLILMWVSPGFAYDVMKVENGGTLTGTVTLVGHVPSPKAYNLVTFPDPQYCGRISNGKGWRLLRDFVVDDQQHLKNVVVLIEGIQAGKSFSLSIPRVEARDCRFLPFITVVRSGHGVEVVNMDPVMHDVQAYETSMGQGTRVLFNSPLPFNHLHRRGDLHATHNHLPGKSMVQQFTLTKGRQTVVMQCGFHAFMESWAIAVDNPYYGFTDGKGNFSIDHIPPGTYRVRAWHPSVKRVIEKTVTINSGLTLSLNFDLPAPSKDRTAYTLQTPARFTPAALGRSFTIQPIVERQTP